MPRFIPFALMASLLASCSTVTQFDPADANKDNSLDITEFRTYAVNAQFDHFDLYKDGRISFAEWKAGDPAANQTGFDRRDSNKDGSITRDEAYANARRLGTSDTLFHLIDTNQNGMIEAPEAEAYAQKAKTTSPRL